MLVQDKLGKLINVLLENFGARDIYFLAKKETGYTIQVEGHATNILVHMPKERTANAECIPFKLYLKEILKDSCILKII